jgi:hypothetical protein
MVDLQPEAVILPKVQTAAASLHAQDVSLLVIRNIKGRLVSQNLPRKFL